MTGNPSLDKIILGINGLVVIAATGLVFYAHNGIKPPPLNENQLMGDQYENARRDFQTPAVSMEEIVVNLYSREARLRFLDVKMDIELFSEADREIVESNKSIINDALIEIAGNMRPDQVNSVTGRLTLESRIKKRVEKHAGKPIIKKIYFSKFIVQ